MIRILHVLGSLEFGGIQSFLLEVYKKMDPDSIAFDFAVYEGELKDNYDEIIALGSKVYEFPPYRGRNHSAFVSWWRNFFKEHPAQYQVLHSHIRSCAMFYLPVARKAGCKCIIHSHSTSNGRGIKALPRDMIQYPLRYMADYLLACSPEAGRFLFGKKNCLVVPNCIDIQHFRFSQDSRDSLRRELGIPDDAFVMGHVGRFIPVKNHAFLLDIFVEVLRRNSKAVLLLVGDGELMDEVSRRCAELGINERVIFAGSHRDVAPFYSAMDVMVIPSLYEGGPITAVEAQCAGLRCFVADTSSKSVFLTNLVKVKSLGESASLWANDILSAAEQYSRCLDEKILSQLSSYDSGSVATELVQFYRQAIL